MGDRHGEPEMHKGSRRVGCDSTSPAVTQLLSKCGGEEENVNGQGQPRETKLEVTRAGSANSAGGG